MKKNMYPRLNPTVAPFFIPKFLASDNSASYLYHTQITCMSHACHMYLSDSLNSPPNDITVLTDERTSSANAPADAYFFCSLLVKRDVT